MRAWHPRGVHDRGDVVRHLLDTESLIGGVGEARAAVIKTQNAKPPQLGQQVVPERQVERGPRDQNERLTLAVDLVVDAGSCRDAMRHRASVRSLSPGIGASCNPRRSSSRCCSCACQFIVGNGLERWLKPVTLYNCHRSERRTRVRVFRVSSDRPRERTASWHGVGPLHMPLIPSDVAIASIALRQVLIGGFLTTALRQQGTQPQYRDIACRPTKINIPLTPKSHMFTHTVVS